jgi:hypothetical protein
MSGYDKKNMKLQGASKNITNSQIVKKNIWKEDKMKKLMMTMIFGCLITAGLAQSQISDNQKNDMSQESPKVEQVEIQRDYFSDMQRSEEKKKRESFIQQSEKTAVVKDMDKTNSQSKIYSKESIKPNQIINKDGALNFGQGKGQVYSRIKRMKKIRRVEDIAPREEIKKIDGHTPVSEDVLIQALGNPKPVHSQSQRTK